MFRYFYSVTPTKLNNFQPKPFLFNVNNFDCVRVFLCYKDNPRRIAYLSNDPDAKAHREIFFAAGEKKYAS